MAPLASLLVFATLAAQVLGATIQILAVQDLTLTDTFVFKPNSVTAEVGDTLEFHFAPTGFIASNHSVAQGTFNAGCQPMENGFFSGNITAEPDTDLGEAVSTRETFLLRKTGPWRCRWVLSGS